MSPLLRLFSPLRHAAVAFFKHDLVLQRKPDGVHLALQEPVEGSHGKPRKPTRLDEAGRREQQELSLILNQLHALLDELPESRATLRHLCLVEQAVAKKGMHALHQLPLDVLQHALSQLEGLVTNWSPVGLASLRSKMAVAIIDREHMDPEREADAYKTSAVLEGPVEVSLGGPKLPEVVDSADDDALVAAYAALGAAAPIDTPLEVTTELGAKSARAVAGNAPRLASQTGEIKLRELQP